MHRVEKIDSGSVQSLLNLCALIDQAIPDQIHRRQVSSWTWIGLYTDNGQFGVGIHLANPELVEFVTAQYCVSADAASKVCEGELYDSEYPAWTKGPYRWRNQFDLTANGGEFYTLSKTEQLLRLEAFLLRSRTIALSLGENVA
jgi:hypothetical protein